VFNVISIHNYFVNIVQVVQFFSFVKLTLLNPTVTLCRAGLITSKNRTFYPHSVIICYVCVSEPTAIISLYNINLFVFVTERDRAFCAVRTGFLNTVQVNFSLIGLKKIV
jgi:hypothetical protein